MDLRWNTQALSSRAALSVAPAVSAEWRGVGRRASVPCRVLLAGAYVGAMVLPGIWLHRPQTLFWRICVLGVNTDAHKDFSCALGYTIEEVRTASRMSTEFVHESQHALLQGTWA